MRYGRAPIMADLPVLFADLVRLEIELWDAVEARLRAELGVDLSTAQTLAVVDDVPDCRVHDIARGLSITVGGASKTVDRLERAGLVGRRQHPRDRRSSVIALTRTGATTHAEAQRLIAAELDARIGGVLSDRAADQLHRSIGRLRAALATASPRGTPPEGRRDARPTTPAAPGRSPP